MNKEIVPIMKIVILVLGFWLIFTGCTNEEDGELKFECGLLTINNLPVVPAEYLFGYQVCWIGGIYFNPDKIESKLDVHNWTYSNEVAYFGKPDGSYSSVSPFSLRDSNNVTKGFLKSGTYMIHIQPLNTHSSLNRAIMTDVTFIKGKATIDYNDMTLYYNLPYSN